MKHKLTLRKALPKMFKAFRERKLICQNGGQNVGYRREDGCMCIVGAGLPDKTLVELLNAKRNQNGLDVLHDYNHVEFKSDSEQEVFGELMDLHDEGCAGAKLYRRKQRRQLAAKLNKLAKDLKLDLQPLHVS